MATTSADAISSSPERSVPFPPDYAERVYAGVLGKIIGVYLGRPIEGWRYERITAEIGEVDRYLAGENGAPLVVTDDDLTGTFTFLRALEDNGFPLDLTPAQVGECWLNYTIERRTIFWWGGVGTSTEHTAYARLRSGIPAPESGSRGRNGRIISEQIGAQIFIDGWAMLAPGDPELAADLARRAASVSHDGEAIYGAQVIAAMEAQAFVERDINHLIETGLSVIPAGSVIAHLINQIREWHAAESDWRVTRGRIAAEYGYDRYLGACHMVPNHALIIHALLYGGGDFRRSQMIVNTSGWDTDCNAGNLGCLLGIRGGLATFDGAYDWRGPVADRMYLSTAEGSRAITDALTGSDRIIQAASAMRGAPFSSPKEGARFHFSMPGAVQGFQVDEGSDAMIANPDGIALRIAPAGAAPVRVFTPTFIPPEALTMPGHQLFASPTLYHGQTVTVSMRNDGIGEAAVRLAIRYYGEDDRSELVTGDAVAIAAGEAQTLTWTVPDLGGKPVHAVGVEVSGSPVSVEWLTWDGAPSVTFKRPDAPGATLWRRAWVDAVDHFDARWPEAFRIGQDRGRGLLSQGGDWTDYRVSAVITPYLATRAGIAARVGGLRRYYAVLLCDDAVARLVKVENGEHVLAEQPFAWEGFRTYELTLEVNGDHITGTVDGSATLAATDPGSWLRSGGAGFVIEEGSMSSDAMTISPTGDDVKTPVIFRASDADAYAKWLEHHERGYVIHLKPSRPMIHTARCPHLYPPIPQYREPTRIPKACSDDRDALEQLATDKGLVLALCSTCKV